MAYSPDEEFLLEKPKRPLSAYNYYFAFERQKLLAERQQHAQTERGTSKGIGFAAMGRTIANKWNNLKLHEKTQFQELAKKDKLRYKKEMDLWKESQNRASQMASGQQGYSEGPPMEIFLSLESGQEPLPLDPISTSDGQFSPIYTSTSARLLQIFHARSLQQPEGHTAQADSSAQCAPSSNHMANHDCYLEQNQFHDCSSDVPPQVHEQPSIRHSSSASRLLQLFQARSRSSNGNFSA